MITVPVIQLAHKSPIRFSFPVYYSSNQLKHMNRSLIVVKIRPKMFCSIRLHWEYGQKIEDWLNSLNLSEIHDLIAVGHRSTIKESYRALPYTLPDADCKHWTHKTLKEAVLNIEHKTLAYHNGKTWKFTHNND